MSLARVKTWISEVLTASDLNAEFDNIINNQGGSFGTPRTADLDMGSGNALLTDTISESTSTSGVTIDGVLLKDGNITISNSAPQINLTDTTTNADSTIGANSANGSISINADVNSESASSAVIFTADGTTCASFSATQASFDQDIHIASGKDMIFTADGTNDIGKTAARAANVWSDLINGADYGFDNNWRALESDTYEGYGPGIAFDFGDHFTPGKALAVKRTNTGRKVKDEEGNDTDIDETTRERVTNIAKKPNFAVTEDFIEFKGRRITAEQLDKLLALV